MVIEGHIEVNKEVETQESKATSQTSEQKEVGENTNKDKAKEQDETEQK